MLASNHFVFHECKIKLFSKHTFRVPCNSLKGSTHLENIFLWYQKRPGIHISSRLFSLFSLRLTPAPSLSLCPPPLFSLAMVRCHVFSPKWTCSVDSGWLTLWTRGLLNDCFQRQVFFFSGGFCQQHLEEAKPLTVC